MLRGTVVVIGLGAALMAAGCGSGGGEPMSPPPPNPLYVSQIRGADANTGDAQHPLQTISRAATLALDGYIVYVGSGTYREGVTTDRVGMVPAGVRFVADVTGQYTGDPPGPVTIDASHSPANLAAGFKLTKAGCVTIGMQTICSLIAGFEITGGKDAGIVVKHSSDGITIENCVIHDNPGDGMRVLDSEDAVIFNNLVYRNGATNGSGQAISGLGVGIVGDISGSPNARVYSNTIYGNLLYGLQVGVSSTASPRATVLNNIIQNNGSGTMGFNIKVFTGPSAGSVSGYHGDYNIVSPPTYNGTLSIIVGKHDHAQNALFLNAGAGNYHVAAASVALDAGAPLDLFDPVKMLLNERSVTGTSLDSGVLDIGFHYCVSDTNCPVAAPDQLLLP